MAFSLIPTIIAVGLVSFSLSSAAVVHRPALSDTPAKPKWPPSYIISGKILLPYAEIVEPFTAYFDTPHNRSRIDYYDSMVKTYQRGDKPEYGEMLKVAPMAGDDGKVNTTCFAVNGTETGRVGPQNVLPDLDDFEFTDNRTCGFGADGVCEAWSSTEYPLSNNKIDRFLLLVKRDSHGDAQPVAYEMQGYDTLFGSHYDRYILEYGPLNATEPDATVFEPSNTLQCTGFPGPGLQHKGASRATMNPIHAFVHNDHAHVESAFDEFKATHGKSYVDDKEHHERRLTFVNNFRYVESMNRRGLSFGLAINHLADRSEDELRTLRGRVSSNENGSNGMLYEKIMDNRPENWDWRLLGAVTPVKDQAICGSCWSFGTVGAIEGANFVKTSNLTDLSPQSLMDCSWDHGNNGCDGGEDWRAYEWIIQHGGIMSQNDYGPYLGEDGRCHHDSSKVTVKFDKYLNIASNASDAGIAILESAILQYGPVAIGIDAAPRSFSFYDNGVFHDPDCKSGPQDLDHSVLAVGFGTSSKTNQRYWLVKNSWSTYWGNDGYVLMAQAANDCGQKCSKMSTAIQEARKLFEVLPPPPPPT